MRRNFCIESEQGNWSRFTLKLLFESRRLGINQCIETILLTSRWSFEECHFLGVICNPADSLERRTRSRSCCCRTCSASLKIAVGQSSQVACHIHSEQTILFGFYDLVCNPLLKDQPQAGGEWGGVRGVGGGVGKPQGAGRLLLS